MSPRAHISAIDFADASIFAAQRIFRRLEGFENKPTPAQFRNMALGEDDLKR